MTVYFDHRPHAADGDTLQFALGAYQAADGCRLQAYRWCSRNALHGTAALVVVMHGYGEHCERYSELARQLVARGHVVCGFDARGHGRSPGQRGHIADYELYVGDLHRFMQEMRTQHRGRALVLLGHSNGGLTSLRAVQSRRPLPDGLILSSPMVALQPAHRPLPLWLAALVARVVGRLPLPNGIDQAELSRDPQIVEAARRDPLSHSRTTPGWYAAAGRAMQQAISQLDAIRLPLLLLIGDHDPVVDPEALERMARTIPSTDKEVVVCRGALHEVLNDLGREQLHQRIESWLAGRFGTAVAA
jgi:lysophospholipase